MKRKNKKDYEMVITPYMKKLDETLLKINQNLAEIRAELKLLNKSYHQINTWITRIYEHLDQIERDTQFLIYKEKEREENKLINKIKKWLSLYPVMRC